MNRLAVGLATGAVLAALAVPLLPGSATGLATTQVAVAGVAAGSIGLGVLLWLQQGSSGRSRELSRESTASGDDRVGRRIDAAVRSASSNSPPQRHVRVRRTVRRTLETVLVERVGLSRSEAVERRRAGTWTSNPRAATLLGETDARPWRMRARDWLHGDAFARNLRATIAELDRLVTDLDRTHRVETLWERDHRNDGDEGVATMSGRRDGATRAGGPPSRNERPWYDEARSRDDRAWYEEPRSQADRERLDDSLDERASALSRSGTGDSTDGPDGTADAEASEVKR